MELLAKVVATIAWVPPLKKEMRRAIVYGSVLVAILVSVWWMGIAEIRFTPLTTLSISLALSASLLFLIWKLGSIIGRNVGIGIHLVSQLVFFSVFGKNAAPISALLTTAAILFQWHPKH